MEEKKNGRITYTFSPAPPTKMCNQTVTTIYSPHKRFYFFIHIYTGENRSEREQAEETERESEENTHMSQTR